MLPKKKNHLFLKTLPSIFSLGFPFFPTFRDFAFLFLHLKKSKFSNKTGQMMQEI